MTDLRVPILNTEYAVVVAWGDVATLNRVLKKWGYPEYDQLSEFNMRGRCIWHHQCHPVILLPSPPRDHTEIATLAHEAVHAVFHVLDAIGATLDTEIIGHSVGAIVRETLKRVEKVPLD